MQVIFYICTCILQANLIIISKYKKNETNNFNNGSVFWLWFDIG